MPSKTVQLHCDENGNMRMTILTGLLIFTYKRFSPSCCTGISSSSISSPHILLQQHQHREHQHLGHPVGWVLSWIKNRHFNSSFFFFRCTTRCRAIPCLSKTRVHHFGLTNVARIACTPTLIQNGGQPFWINKCCANCVHSHVDPKWWTTILD